MSLESSRRHFLVSGTAMSVAAAAGTATRTASAFTEEPREFPALLPRGGTGHHFVFYADCCSGVPNAPNATSHAAVNRVVARIQPRPEFIAFPGDAVTGYVNDYTALRQQWDYWWNTEMAWLKPLGIPLYQSTSNHNTYDLGSEQVFREFHPDLPQNGPDEFRGLAYFVRRGDLLYVSTHQPDRTRAYRNKMTIDPAWLDQVLTANADARYKFVCGHYPVFPVNGYFQSPQWCFRPAERKPFWDVLVKHRVHAYLCSHILAFDVQIHDGIPQILSGGAGTQGSGPLALMPLRSEYLHAVQMAIDEQGLRARTIDITGSIRESFAWPCSLPSSDRWTPLSPANLGTQLAPHHASGKISAWRIQAKAWPPSTGGEPQTLLWGWDGMEGLATVWIGIEGSPARWTVRLIPQSGFGWQVWTGPLVTFDPSPDRAFEGQIALHAGLGPGGILFRANDRAPWQSLYSTSSKGIEDLTWPQAWTLGHGPSGADEWPFLGRELRIDWISNPLSAE
jgi:hypothetical protein